MESGTKLSWVGSRAKFFRRTEGRINFVKMKKHNTITGLKMCNE